MNKGHPIEYLFELLGSFGDYPEGMIAVPEDRIEGLAFFPGGSGLWITEAANPLPPMPVGGTMIIGNNFHNVRGFEYSRKQGGESSKNPTWRNLLQVMEKVGLDKEKCFFTNAYMGLLTADSAEGEAPGARDINFRTRCIRYLGEQIRVAQPRLILTLGKYVPPVLAELSPDLKTWLKASNVTYLDKLEAGLFYPVTFEGITSPVAVVALTHPARRNLNVKRRFYKGLMGEEAEQALVKTALHLIEEK